MRTISASANELDEPEICVSAEGSQLVVEGPEHLLTDQLLEELTAKKPQILRLLLWNRKTNSSFGRWPRSPEGDNQETGAQLNLDHA